MPACLHRLHLLTKETITQMKASHLLPATHPQSNRPTWPVPAIPALHTMTGVSLRSLTTKGHMLRYIDERIPYALALVCMALRGLISLFTGYQLCQLFCLQLCSVFCHAIALFPPRWPLYLTAILLNSAYLPNADWGKYFVLFYVTRPVFQNCSNQMPKRNTHLHRYFKRVRTPTFWDMAFTAT